MNLAHKTEAPLLFGKIRVQVKPILMELVPAYLKRRYEDVSNLKQMAQARDFQGIQMIGHKLCGNASTYGFHEISRIGSELEAAARSEESNKIDGLAAYLAAYLDRVEVVSC